MNTVEKIVKNPTGILHSVSVRSVMTKQHDLIYRLKPCLQRKNAKWNQQWKNWQSWSLFGWTGWISRMHHSSKNGQISEITIPVRSKRLTSPPIACLWKVTTVRSPFTTPTYIVLCMLSETGSPLQRKNRCMTRRTSVSTGCIRRMTLYSSMTVSTMRTNLCTEKTSTETTVSLRGQATGVLDHVHTGVATEDKWRKPFLNHSYKHIFKSEQRDSTGILSFSLEHTSNLCNSLFRCAWRPKRRLRKVWSYSLTTGSCDAVVFADQKQTTVCRKRICDHCSLLDSKNCLQPPITLSQWASWSLKRTIVEKQQHYVLEHQWRGDLYTQPRTYKFKSQTQHVTRLLFCCNTAERAALCRDSRQTDRNSDRSTCLYNAKECEEQTVTECRTNEKTDNRRLQAAQQRYKQGYDGPVWRQQTLIVGDEVFVTWLPLAAFTENDVKLLARSL